jgi:hypothetical protein
MRYNVWLIREDGTPSPAGPSQISACGIVDAQRLAQQTLDDLQRVGALVGWTIKTVTECS